MHRGLTRLVGALVALVVAVPMAFAQLPAEELWREQLLNHRVGFGKDATGGAGGTLCTVTNLNDSGAGSLRACATGSGARWVIFSVSGTINLLDRIEVTSNTTIDGRGANITLTSANRQVFLMYQQSNVIIHNLTFGCPSDDCVSIMFGSSNVWIDHVTFGDSADEQLYIGAFGGLGVPGVTVSWNLFVGVPETLGSGAILVSSNDQETNDADTRITFHHNHYDHTVIRHPLARFATMHAFNNYYNTNDYGAQIRTHGKFWSENEYFLAPSTNAYPSVSWAPDDCPTCEPVGADIVKVTGHTCINCGVDAINEVNASSYPTLPYTYTAATSNTALRDAIIAQAGRQDNPYPEIPPAAPLNLRVVSP
jgi:pectate lyase